jgi:hypothetical protein
MQDLTSQQKDGCIERKMNPTSAQFPSPVLSKNGESETGRIPFFSIGIPTIMIE